MGIPGESLKREFRKPQKWEFSFFPAQYQLSCSGQGTEKALVNTVPKKFISLGL